MSKQKQTELKKIKVQLIRLKSDLLKAHTQKETKYLDPLPADL